MLIRTRPKVKPDEMPNPCSGGTIERPALRYFGGKWRLAPWILQHFPEHRIYCEPYAGAFSVGLRKRPAAVDVLNERNPGVTNFFEVLKDWPQELITALNASPKTRDEFKRCMVIEGNAFERARRFYLFCQMSFSNGGGRWSSGTSEERLRLVQSQDCDYLMAVSQRLANVQITHDLAEVAIAKYDSPETLFYIDPPYVQSTRGSKDTRHINGAPRRQYAYEMDDDGHRQLAEQLHSAKGMVVLSGYESALYAELYPGWRCVKKQIQTRQGLRTECLWLKPTAGERIYLPLSFGDKCVWAPSLVRSDGLIEIHAHTNGVPITAYHDWNAVISKNCRQQPTATATSVITDSNQSKHRKHNQKGQASGWLESRTGNRKRKTPSISYYYRWDSPQGRITEYVSTSKLSEVSRMLAENYPALEILRYVVKGKKKLSKSVQSLLANSNTVEV
ncbi:site-specific DNA methylase [Leptolyngbya sp. PCC 7375]|nr:site-specific DNA methylase [Leptolyngbya sp. PCC 7375]